MLEQLCWLGLIMILHVLPPVSVTSIATYIEGYHEKGRLPHTNGEQFDTWSWWHERMAHISDRNSLRYFSSGVFGSELQKRDVQTAVCQISHACNVSTSQLGVRTSCSAVADCRLYIYDLKQSLTPFFLRILLINEWPAQWKREKWTKGANAQRDNDKKCTKNAVFIHFTIK